MVNQATRQTATSATEATLRIANHLLRAPRRSGAELPSVVRSRELQSVRRATYSPQNAAPSTREPESWFRSTAHQRAIGVATVRPRPSDPDRLRELYGRPSAPPHGHGLDELILTVLSQSTNDRNRDVAFLRLRDRFPSWEAVRDAPNEEVEAAIRPGGISKVKSRAHPGDPARAAGSARRAAPARPGVPGLAARRRPQDRGLRAAVRVRRARRAGRHPRLARRHAARPASARARRSPSCTTRCSRSRPRGRSSSCT